tara:strand:+ start:240 stop:416 length:177 start_codon:yes stop_codon:yes gene_type:complete
MENYRVDIMSVPCDDQKAIIAVQQKINQWITIGLLSKYEMHTTATHIVFNICKKKEAE